MTSIRHEQDQPLNPGEEEVKQLLLSEDARALHEAANKLNASRRFKEAALIYTRLIELNKQDLVARFMYAQVIEDGTHKKRAESRDLMLAVLEEFPAVFNFSAEANQLLIRGAAERCSHVGPMEKAIELYRKLASLSNLASDYFLLSEILSQGNFLEESVAALEKAILLDPRTFDNDANRETLRIAKAGGARDDGAAKRKQRKKIGRYPSTEDFLGDFQALVKNHVAVNLGNEEKFINRQTRFFTMGSCFARNISRSLMRSGYTSVHMEISEHINTTFANRAFVDWLSGAGGNASVNERIRELMPPGWSAENTLRIIGGSNVFVLTLGVAPAFFDRTTGAFVLPRPTALNARALAEKYQYRTTTVQENVENVLYLIQFIRAVSPGIKIIVTVSPVPLLASFEYESCIQADCLSKSTMRLVAHEVVNNSNLGNILYWPSFEVFRWAGSNASDYYAADDGAAWHVSEEKINGTIKAFIDIFKSEQAK